MGKVWWAFNVKPWQILTWAKDEMIIHDGYFIKWFIIWWGHRTLSMGSGVMRHKTKVELKVWQAMVKVKVQQA